MATAKVMNGVTIGEGLRDIELGTPSEKDFNAPLEKDFCHTDNSCPNGNTNAYDTYDHHAELERVRTANSVVMSPELFEKLYLSPQNKVHGKLRRTFANPTPVGLVGLLMCATTGSMDTMKWGGATGTGSGGNGFLPFFGGSLMMLASLGEFILGNTFPCVIFGNFGAWFFGLSATFRPTFNTFAAYSTDPSNPSEGLEAVGFRTYMAFFHFAMGAMVTVFLVCALRTNMVLFMIFMTLAFAFPLIGASFLQFNKGNIAAGDNLQEAGGAFMFVTVMFTWWQFIGIMLAELDFPFQLPVGDLSKLIKGASERKMT